jgi:hypothetical protein
MAAAEVLLRDRTLPIAEDAPLTQWIEIGVSRGGHVTTTMVRIAQAIADAEARGAAQRGAELHTTIAQASRNYAPLLELVQELTTAADDVLTGGRPTDLINTLDRARALLKEHGR